MLSFFSGKRRIEFFFNIICSYSSLISIEIITPLFLIDSNLDRIQLTGSAVNVHSQCLTCLDKSMSDIASRIGL